MIRTAFPWLCLVCLLASSSPLACAEASADEKTLWDLERAYWRYLEANDLVAYSDLGWNVHAG